MSGEVLSKPTVSVVMGVYNETTEMLKESIESILNQTFKDFEFIIVIDNPDALEQIKFIEKMSEEDRRIKVIQNRNNIGLAKTLNKGIEIAKGDYIARMDADDVSFSTRLEMEFAYLKEHTECDLVYSTKIDMNECGDIQKGKIVIPKNDKCLIQSLQYGSIIVHPSVFMKATSVKKIGGYNEYFASQDYDLWLRMAQNGYKMHCIKDTLLYYRIRKESITSKKCVVQYASTEYARYLFKFNKEFNLDEYINFINLRLNNTKFVKWQKKIVEANNKKLLIQKIWGIIQCILADKESRKRVYNMLRMKKYIIKIVMP